MLSIASSWTASQSTKPPTDDELIKALIENKDELASVITDYFRQEQVIADLEKALTQIKKDSSESLQVIDSMQNTINDLKQRNEAMKDIILASQETNKKQVEEFSKELSAERKRGTKKMFYGILGGVVVGMFIMAAAQ